MGPNFKWHLTSQEGMAWGKKAQEALLHVLLNASSDPTERKYEISEEKLIITRRLMMLQWG